MTINNDNFLSLLKSKIEKISNKSNFSIEGKVISIQDGVAIVSGLDSVMVNEVVKFENGSYGIALNLETTCTGIVLIGKYDDIKEGSIVKKTNSVISIPVGNNLVGRVINPLGESLDDKETLLGNNKIKMCPIDKIAPGVLTRKSIDSPIETGIFLIDSIFPIGKGQRELIIGDRQTGKTTIAISTIINQKNKNVKCVYVSIGQKNSSLSKIIKTLEENNAMEYTTVIAAGASDLPMLNYIAPYAGITIAEEWMSKGEDVLIVFDDLTKHAIAYRTISLLLRRPSGREAYPGDIFYLHSKLLERSCKLNNKYGGGSISALPIIETQNGDISSFIPTNIISITDGQLFFQTNLFNLNQRPAIDIGLSVSRVGSAAQYKPIKQLSSSLKINLSLYYELASFGKFGSDLDEETLKIIENGKKIIELIKQKQNIHYSLTEEISICFIIHHKIIEFIPYSEINFFFDLFLKEFSHNEIIANIITENNVSDENTNILLNEILKFTKKFVNTIENYDDELLNKLNKKISQIKLKKYDDDKEEK